MALTPIEITLTDEYYTRIVNNSTEYLAQNAGNSLIYIAGSSTDLGATTTTDLGGYKINSLLSVDNSQLKNYPYVYAKSMVGSGLVLV